ncbi:PREDICTED: tetraspanin-32 [Crocodylus porosus]|uniref:tetraspanin-32 n=1 Tax=Crocodylus porosus TaxID=8502 RepID=UPI00094057D6|nr:PREDICTED: tetraspanin-32 [Crocodylus porosus]
MGQQCQIRATKCQLLVTSLFVMLLGFSLAILTTLTHFGAPFTIISGVSYNANPYRIIHNAVFYSGMCLSMILFLAALLSFVATVKESRCLMAMGFFCFAVVFCGLILAAFWRYSNTEVEDAMMDVYDLVYEEVRRNSSSFRKEELTAIHETFLCCGKYSPFEEIRGIENGTCPSTLTSTAREDCLQQIQDFMKKHMRYVSTLLIITLCLMVYGMVLTSFLWFSIHFSNNLDRKGKYVLRKR